MKDIDRLIDKALDEEERDLLGRIGEEPGFSAKLSASSPARPAG
jgi:hypothetical protein